MITVLKATKKDLKSVASLWQQLDTYESKVNKLMCPAKKSRIKKSLLKYHKSKNCLILCAKDNEKVVGYLSLKLDKKEHYWKVRFGHVIDAFVLEKYRHRGIMHKLLKQAQIWLRKKRIKYIEVGALSENVLGRKCWKALGFKENLIHLAKKI